MDSIQQLPDWALFALLGAVGGVCFQIYMNTGSTQAAAKFSIAGLLANGIVASFVSGIAGTYLQSKFPSFAHGIAGALGFGSFPLLQWIEVNGGKILSRKFGLSDADGRDRDSGDESSKPDKPIVSMSATQYVDMRTLLEQAKSLMDRKDNDKDNDKDDKDREVARDD